MSQTRFSALNAVDSRMDLGLNTPFTNEKAVNIASYFAENVFNDAAMHKYLHENAYLSVKAAIESGQKISFEVAEVVAKGMKDWAMDKGCTHFAHWFQPLTGRTAEKHDSFFTMTHDGKVIEEFTGSALVQQEPDGSSFPSGGLRSTFEARGYTVWDPSSPAFLMENGDGITLYVPTIFVTYAGQAQDYKLPLLRSQNVLNEAAIPVCQLFDPNVTKVTATLGWEQEYFLIDEALNNARPDLVATGRTLVGRNSTRNQQLEDHYFGVIPERIYAFMRDLEVECHKLGIPVRTRHNEVAPAQYEVAPMFEEVNVAVDHNQLLMDTMERVARRHKLRVLLHEKPFAGVNGSGKHNNWSMSTNTGVNLLSPGKTPGKNLRFLTFFVNTIASVHKYADVLRAAIAGAGNDHRLGANEAPPAIISVFIGDHMSKLLKTIASGETTGDDGVKLALDLLSKLPDMEKDNTDRNRTSPFAFTGNKFEIRAVGSSQSCAASMTAMNTMMATQLNAFEKATRQLMAGGMEKDLAILQVIRESIRTAWPIVFEGNNYSDEWRIEAESRGLNNFNTTPAALDVLGKQLAKDLYGDARVFSNTELEAYHNVQLHSYINRIQIEANTLDEMMRTMVLPVAARAQTELADNLSALAAVDLATKSHYQSKTLKAISAGIEEMYQLLEKLDTDLESLHHQADSRAEAEVCCMAVRPCMDAIRVQCDTLEGLIDDQYWPLVKYRELLFCGK
jgi:glutamine synthetase